MKERKPAIEGWFTLGLGELDQGFVLLGREVVLMKLMSVDRADNEFRADRAGLDVCSGSTFARGASSRGR